MTDAPSLRMLAGGRLGVAERKDWVRVAVAQAAFLWLAPWPMMAIGRWAGPRARQWLERWWARRVSSAIGLKLEVRGTNHIQPRQPYLVLPLHEGLADPLALLHLPVPLRFVVRDEFAGWPILGAYLKATRQLLVSDARPTIARGFLATAREAVRRGESVVVFPQGSVLGLEIGFRPGAVRLARSLQIPVLPVVITGSHRVWEHPFSPLLRCRQRVTMTVMAPLVVRHLRRDGLNGLSRELERRMKRIARSPWHCPPRHYLPGRDGTWEGYDFVIDPAFSDLVRLLPHRVRAARRVSHSLRSADQST